MNSLLSEFKNKCRKKELKVAVVGLGYVGLPLAIEFAKKGFSVLGIELDRERLARINRQKSYITDVPGELLKKVIHNGRFRAEGTFHSLKYIDVILICVPTPLKKKHHPDISFIKNAVRAVSANMKEGALIILESTTYPGTTEEVILPLLEGPGRKHGRDFYLCFSPERIDPGNSRYPLSKIPKVIGGINKEATQLGVLVYKNIVGRTVPVSSARVAETTKLLENTFRLINIGLIDELAMMAHRMNIDIWEIIRAASTKPFGFMPFYPGPGVGGHCIPKDPLYLYWKAKHHGFTSRFIRLASQVISSMPEYIAGRIEDMLKKRNKTLAGSNILIIGVTYKKDIKDLRKSPSLDLIQSLRKRKSRVCYYDPLIPYLKINNLNLKSINLADKKKLNKFDCVVIATPHSQINYKYLLGNARLIFDTRNSFGNLKNNKIVKL